MPREAGGALLGRDEPTVTVAIPTRNRGDLIAETIEAVLRVPYPRLSILVVDQSTQSSTETAVRRAAGNDPRVTCHRTNTIGSSAARNLGAILSTTEIVAYTDDDCIVSEDWLSGILREFTNPAIAAVYGRLLPYEAGPRRGTEVGFKSSEETAYFTGKTPPWYVGHGGNMAFRRRVLLEVGGFDPLLGAGGPLRSNEDGDISYRLLATGRQIAYSPAALAYHKHWKTWPEQQKMERAYGIGAGAQFMKYARCGDRYGARLLLRWIWDMGVRRMGAGLLKWRDRHVMYLAYCQLVYPWIGVSQSFRYKVDRARMCYIAPERSPFAVPMSYT